MKKLIPLALLLALTLPAQARNGYTHGYTRSNGTYVHGYHHTRRDGKRWNNYSTKGNVNPYTGKWGHKRLFH